MRIVSSIAIGLLCIMLVVAADTGLEVSSDMGKRPTVLEFMDGITPISSLVTGLLASMVWWSSGRQSDYSFDVLITLIATLAATAIAVATFTIMPHFLLMNGVRPTPWYRWVVSLAIYASLGRVVFTNVAMKKIAERDDADQPAATQEPEAEGNEKPKPESEGRSQ